MNSNFKHVLSALAIIATNLSPLCAEDSEPKEIAAIEPAILRPPPVGEDATPIVQAALDKCGTVRLLDGAEFLLRSSLRLGSGQGLVGEAVLIPDFDHELKAGNKNVAIIMKGNNILLDGLEIRKPFIDGSYGIGVLVEPGSRNITLRGLEISGYSARYGILVVESKNLEITGCTVRDFMMNAAADMIGDSPAGIALKRCVNGVVSNNRVQRIECGPEGLVSISPLKPDYGPQGYQSDHFTIQSCQGIALTGNVMKTSGEGLDMLLSTGCTISGNVIDDIWFQGIKMLGVSATTISGNTISNTYQGIGLSTHPPFESECENNAVVGNVILDTGTPGSFRRIAAERVRGTGVAAIAVQQTSRNNVIVGNVIRNLSEEAVMKTPIENNEQPNLIENNILPQSP